MDYNLSAFNPGCRDCLKAVLSAAYFSWVMAYDTVQVSTTVTDTARTRIKHSYEKRCNNISELVLNREAYKDKIVLMEYNKDCDYTRLYCR